MTAGTLWQPGDGRTIQERFEEFHDQYPEVYRMFCDYAAKARAAGFTRFSSDMICHRIRWYRHVERGDRDFKINDHFTSRYARKLMEEDQTFAGFFETRVLKA